MKRKISISMLKWLFAIVIMGVYSSCNDYVEDVSADMKIKLAEQDATLRELINTQIAGLQTQVNTLNGSLKDLQTWKSDLENWKKALNQTLNDYATKDTLNNFATKDYVDDKIANALANIKVGETTLEQTIINVTTNLTNARNSIQNNKTSIDSLCNITTQLNIVASEAKAAAITAQNTADRALELAMADSVRIDDLEKLVKADSIRINELDEKLAKLDGLKETVEGFTKTITELDNFKNQWGPKMQEMFDNAANALSTAKANKLFIDTLKQEYKDLRNDLNGTNMNVDAANKRIDSLAAVTSALAGDVAKVEQLAKDNYAKAIAYTDSALNVVKNELKEALADSIAAQNIKLADLEKAYKKADTELQDQIDDLQDDITDVKKQIAAVEARINALSNRFENVMSKLITGVIVQGAVSPVAGYAALPFNIRTNILAAYYGEAFDRFYFPTTRTANYTNKEEAFTDADVAILGPGIFDSFKAEAGDVLLEEKEGNAGKIYLTVNPNTVDFTGTNFNLVNSLDEASGVKLGALAHSTDKLTFGYTRDGANNAFYEAKATLTAADIDNVKLDIEAGFKSAIKDIITIKDGINFSDVVLAFYNQFNGMLDANAVKATWSDSLGIHSVYSDYGVAATAVKPLSYSFLKDVSYTLPLLPNIGNIDLSGITGTISLDNLDSIHISIPDMKLHIKDMQLNLKGDTIKVAYSYDKPANFAYDKATEKITYTFETVADTIKIDNLVKLTATINEQVNKQMNDMIKDINDQFGTQMDDLKASITGIEDEINGMISSLQGDLDTEVNKLMDNLKTQAGDLANGYVTTVNNYINRINSYIKKINGQLNNANSKLQIVLLYAPTSSTDLAQVNASKAWPTTLALSGAGDQAITLNPTSYTAELIAPAYKKFIAVTNVFKGNASAKGGDAACKAALVKANNADLMCEVIPGTTQAVPFVTSSTYADYTYEIAYAAVDYSGTMTTRRFYVRIK